MKTAMMILAAALLTGSMAFSEVENKDTTDVSKNPITGTKKTVKKHKKVSKSDGVEHSEKATETTKEYKDGNVKKTTETKTTTETK
ncbi:MAG: hypothetical protein H7061_12960 [Bdellovibrionaceae bacterium]|nr:hypothetical protein [Bdellovibrio sp.]